jgi:PKD repeat protein
MKQKIKSIISALTLIVVLALTNNLQAQNCTASYYTVNDPNALNSFHFVNQSTGGVNFYWSFGDGTSSTLFDPHHAYTAPGTYTACLYINDSANNCFDSFCTVITIGSNTNCTANFSSTPDSSLNTFQFTNLSTGGVQYYWSFGDGYNSIQSNPLHTYTASGSYLVCLSIFDSAQQCSSTYCDTVVVGGNTNCNASFWFIPDSMISNQIHFFGSGNLNNTGTVSSWFWEFGDSTTSTVQNPNHQYANSGYYYVCLSITTTTGCTTTYCNYIYVSGGTANCNASFYAYQNGTGVNFVNQSTGGTQYFWDFGDGSYSTQLNPVHYYASSGFYIACLTISDSMQTCTATYCDSVSVQNINGCNATFTYSVDTSGYGYSFVDGSTSSSNIVSYSWSFGDGTSSNLQNPNHTYMQPGSYLVCLNIASSNGCTSSICNTVNVTGSNPCTPIFTNYTDSLTDSTFVILSSPCPYDTIIWNFGDSTIVVTGAGNNINYVQHMYADSGWYNVCVTVIMGTDTLTNCDSIYVPLRMAATGINNLENLKQTFTVAPNPISSNAVISYKLKQQTRVRIEMYNTIGNQVKLIADEKHESGAYSYNINVDDINAGIYILRLTTDLGVNTVKVNISK